MRVVSTASGGDASSETLFRFSQNGSVVSAKYAGGKVRLRFLVGTLSSDQLCFRYAQVDVEGRIDGGSSQCELQRLSDGRLRQLEHFKWDSRTESGTNVLEELAV